MFLSKVPAMSPLLPQTLPPSGIMTLTLFDPFSNLFLLQGGGQVWCICRVPWKLGLRQDSCPCD